MNSNIIVCVAVARRERKEEISERKKRTLENNHRQVPLIKKKFPEIDTSVNEVKHNKRRRLNYKIT